LGRKLEQKIRLVLPSLSPFESGALGILNAKIYALAEFAFRRFGVNEWRLNPADRSA
jgi:hypothetical protein